MKPEQQCVSRVIIVCPNHLLRFYPLITSVPPGVLSVSQSVSHRHSNHLLFSFCSALCVLLGLSAICVSSSNPLKQTVVTLTRPSSTLL